MEYFRLYLHLMEEDFYRKYGSNSEHIKQAIRSLQTGYDKDTMRQRISSLCYDNDYFRYAYLYQYATCHSEMVEYFVADILETCHNQLSDLCSLNCLRITCLGGGPGIDAVAFLRSACRKFNLCNLTSVEITVIDLCSGWEKTMDQLFGTLNSYPGFHVFGTLQCTCEFLKADLTEPWFPKLHKAIQRADLISMVKFVSAADGGSDEGKVPQLLGKVFRSLKEGAVLMFIDNACGGFYQMVDRAATTCRNMDQIYGPSLHHLFKMPWDTLRSDCQKYHKRFDSFPLSATRVSVGVWMKNSFPGNSHYGHGPVLARSQPNGANLQEWKAINGQTLRTNVLQPIVNLKDEPFKVSQSSDARNEKKRQRSRSRSRKSSASRSILMPSSSNIDTMSKSPPPKESRKSRPLLPFASHVNINEEIYKTPGAKQRADADKNNAKPNETLGHRSNDISQSIIHSDQYSWGNTCVKYEYNSYLQTYTPSLPYLVSPLRNVRQETKSTNVQGRKVESVGASNSRPISIHPPDNSFAYNERGTVFSIPTSNVNQGEVNIIEDNADEKCGCSCFSGSCNIL